MAEASRPPLPWEQKIAVGCLILLALQEVQAGILTFTTGKAPGLGRTEPAWTTPIVLGFFIILAIGLCQRQRAAWWGAIVTLPGAAAVHLLQTWRSVPGRLEVICSHCQKPDYFGATWLATHNAFLVAIPVLLILGRLREAVRRPS